MEPRRPMEPFRPAEPPSPFRPVPYLGPRDDEIARVLKEILDTLTGIENRLKKLEELLRSRP